MLIIVDSSLIYIFSYLAMFTMFIYPRESHFKNLFSLESWQQQVLCNEECAKSFMSFILHLLERFDFEFKVLY